MKKEDLKIGDKVLIDHLNYYNEVNSKNSRLGFNSSMQSFMKANINTPVEITFIQLNSKYVRFKKSPYNWVYEGIIIPKLPMKERIKTLVI